MFSADSGQQVRLLKSGETVSVLSLEQQKQLVVDANTLPQVSQVAYLLLNTTDNITVLLFCYKAGTQTNPSCPLPPPVKQEGAISGLKRAHPDSLAAGGDMVLYCVFS